MIDDASVAAAVERVLAEAGRVDVVVNNAGVLCLGVTEAFTIDQFRRQLDVNVVGPARLNRAVRRTCARAAAGSSSTSARSAVA